MKVLYVTNAINKGGVAKVVLNYAIGCCELDPNFSCDIVSFEEPDKKRKEILLNYKINIFVLKPISKAFFSYQKNISRILKNNKYDCIHSHIEYFNWIPCRVAKKQRIPVRVGHAHGQKGNSNSLFYRFIERVGRVLNRRYCTHYLACSKPSGNYVFGNKFTFFPNYSNDVDTIKQAIINRDVIRAKYIKEFRIPNNSIVFGYMGYLGNQKNPLLALKVIRQLKLQKCECCLLMAGEGVDRNILEEYITDFACESYIKILGHREDHIELMSFFDYLMVPSFSEGMSLSLIEGQLLGKKCFVSPGVPKTNDLELGLFCQSTDFSEDSFCDTIMKELTTHLYNPSFSNIENRLQSLENKGYDKKTILKKLMSIYSSSNEKSNLNDM